MQTARLAPGQDTDQPPGVDIATAAAQLGCSVDAIRKRIRRRQLVAKKVDGRWYVVLDQPRRWTSPVQPVAAATASRGQDADQDASPLVQALQAEVAFLRRTLETRDEELRRRDSIILALAQRPALPEPTAPAVGEPDVTYVTPPDFPRVESSRPWYRRWAWWRRTGVTGHDTR